MFSTKSYPNKLDEFTEIDWFPIDVSCHLTQLVSKRTGLTIYHFKRKVPKFVSRIVVDITANRSYETSSLMAFQLSKFFTAVHESGKHDYSHYGSKANYCGAEYSLSSFGWSCFQKSLRFQLDTLLNQKLQLRLVGLDSLDLRSACTVPPSEMLVINKILGCYEQIKFQLDTLSFGGITEKDILEYRETTHRPENMAIIFEGNVTQTQLLYFIASLEDEFFKSSILARQSLDFKPVYRNVLALPADYPKGKKLDISVAGKTSQYSISWKFEAREPIHYIALWILKAYFRYKITRKFDFQLFICFEEFMRSIFTIPSESPIKSIDLKRFSSEPRSYQQELLLVRKFIEKAIFYDLDTLQTQLHDHIASNFLYEEVNLKMLKNWANAREHYRTLLTWKATDWNKIIDLYLPNSEAYTLNLIASKDLEKLDYEIGMDFFRASNALNPPAVVDSSPEVVLEEVVNLNVINHDDIESQSERSQEQTIDNAPRVPNFVIEDPYAEVEIEEIIECDHIEYPSTLSYLTLLEPCSRLIDYVESELSEGIVSDSMGLRIAVHFKDFESEVSSCYIVMDNGHIGPEHELLLPLFMKLFNLRFNQLFSELDNAASQCVLSFSFDEGFVSREPEDLSNSSLGWDTSQETLRVATMKVSCYPEDYETTMEWLRDFITNFLDGNWSIENIQSLLHGSASAQELHLFEEALQKSGSTFEELAAQVFQLDNMKVFILGTLSELEFSLSPWHDFADAIEIRTGPSYQPLELEDIQKSWGYEEYVPNVGKMVLVENERSGTEWSISISPIDRDKSEYLRILTSMLFFQTSWNWKQSFYIGQGKILCDMTLLGRFEEDCALWEVYLDYDNAWDNYSNYDTERKHDILSNPPFRCNGPFDIALIKVNSMLRNEDPEKAQKFGDIVIDLTSDEIKKYWREYFRKAIDSEVSSMIFGVSSENTYCMPMFFDLTPESEEEAIMRGLINSGQ